MSQPFALYTHCDIVRAEYAGRWWVSAAPLPQLTARAADDGVTATDDYLDGLVTPNGVDRLRFVIQDAGVEESGTVVDLVATDVPTTWCE